MVPCSLHSALPLQLHDQLPGVVDLRYADHATYSPCSYLLPEDLEFAGATELVAYYLGRYAGRSRVFDDLGVG